jgi:hypothetical protein
MSRSYKKHPYIKYGGDSDKKYRTIANKKLRRVNKLKLIQDPEDGNFKILREVSDTWEFPSDGLAYYTKNCKKEWLRK